MQQPSAAPDTARITAAIYLLDLLMVMGKYLPLIAGAFAAISIAFAAYDFATANYGWAIVSAIFGVGGLIFVAQLMQRRNIHSYDYRRKSM
jgi:hypothetical protein